MAPMRTACLLLVVLLAGLVPELARAQGASDAYYEFLMARRLESEGDNRGALAALERAAIADPRSAEVKAEIAAYYLRRNQRPDAEKAARAALAIDEKNVEANRVLGQIFAAAVDAGTARTPAADAARNLRDAIMHLERVIAGSPVVDVATQYTLGRLYIRSGATDKAIQSLTRVLGQNPNSLQGRLALSQAYAAAKDLKSAMGVLEEILAEDPRVADPLGRYQEQAGLFVEAATTYSLALQVRPNDADLKFRRVAALYNAKDFRRAAGFAGDAKRQHPEDPRFPRFQARAQFDAGDRTGAISLMESTAKTFPKDSSTQYALADLYTDAGRHQEAETVLRQVLATDPNNPNALNYLGYLLAVRGDQLDEAIRLVRRALDAEPNNGAYLDSLGWAYFRRGDLNEAEKYLGAAVERLPENSEVHEHMGDLHARRGRLPEAIAAWMRALEADGQDVDRAVLEKKIADARAKLRR